MQNYGSLEYSGGGGTPGPGSIPLTSLAPQAANTVVANNTGGAASPTAVPYASMPWVLKAGDTMSGTLAITVAGGAAARLNATGEGSTGVTGERYSADSLSASFTHNKARGTIAAPGNVLQNDFLSRWFVAGYAGGAFRTAGDLRVEAAAVTPSATDMRGRFMIDLSASGAINPTNVAAFLGGGGMAMAGQTDQGFATVSALALYENGTALSAKYAQLAAANTFTLGQNIDTSGAGIPLPAGFQAQLVGSSPAGLRLEAFANPGTVQARRANGTAGAKTALALDDIMAIWNAQGYDGAAYSTQRVGIQFIANQAWTGAAQGTRIHLITTPNGSTTAAVAFVVGDDGSLFAGGLTKQGAGTLNANALYTNGALAVDASNTHFIASFTFATLPTATANRRATITDSAAAPVFSAAAAGGGALRIPVYGDGATWRNG